MASGGNGRLTNKQYVQLADTISGRDMETIAQEFFNIDSEIIASIKQENRGVAWCNTEMLKRWACQEANSGPQ